MKLHPNDVIALVAGIALTASILITAFSYPLGLVCFFVGNGAILGLNHYENRIYKKGGKISWLDYIRIRDQMAHGHNYEAILLTMKTAYGMDEKQVQALRPEDLQTLMDRLKVEKEMS